MSNYEVKSATICCYCENCKKTQFRVIKGDQKELQCKYCGKQIKLEGE